MIPIPKLSFWLIYSNLLTGGKRRGKDTCEAGACTDQARGHRAQIRAVVEELQRSRRDKMQALLAKM